VNSKATNDNSARRSATVAPRRHVHAPANAAPAPRTLRAQYQAFIRDLLRQRPRCESCGHTAQEVGQPRLHVHHCMRVELLGVHDPATTDAGNALVLCNQCHALMHPLKRRYDELAWRGAGAERGRALSR